MAACGAGAADGNAGGRFPQQPIARGIRKPYSRLPAVAVAVSAAVAETLPPVATITVDGRAASSAANDFSLS